MMKGQLAGLMKQAQMMQENMKKGQAELANVEVEGQSGAGMVKVVVTCSHDVRRVSIDPSVMDDKEMLEDYLVNVFNKAIAKASSINELELAAVAKAGMPNIPGMDLFK